MRGINHEEAGMEMRIEKRIKKVKNEIEIEMTKTVPMRGACRYLPEKDRCEKIG